MATLGNVTQQQPSRSLAMVSPPRPWPPFEHFLRCFQNQGGSSPRTAASKLGMTRWYSCPLLLLQTASQGSFPRVTRENTPAD